MARPVEPRIADAEDWRARMETVKGTFSSRVGQICNAALDRSIIAYNENSDDEERRRCREAVSAKCRELLDGIVKPVTAARYVVALGKRNLLWELLPDAVLPNVPEVRHDK